MAIHPRKATKSTARRIRADAPTKGRSGRGPRRKPLTAFQRKFANRVAKKNISQGKTPSGNASRRGPKRAPKPGQLVSGGVFKPVRALEGIIQGKGRGGRKGSTNPAGIVRGSGGVRRPRRLALARALGTRTPSGRRVAGSRFRRTGGSLVRRATAAGALPAQRKATAARKSAARRRRA